MAVYELDDLQEEVGETYYTPTAAEVLSVLMDAGNTDVKGMLHGHFGREVTFPQYVRKVNATEYKALTAAYKFKKQEFEGTAIFELDGQGYVVGQHAAQVGDGVNKLGVEKYTRDHLGAIFVAMMLMIYPRGHESINLVILHPAKLSEENMKSMGRSVNGRFNVKLPDSTKVTYIVKQVIPMEESVAAFQTFALTTQGRAYQNPRFVLKPGMQFLTIDIGGWIASIVPGIVTPRGRLEINRSAAMPIQVGIQNVTMTLEPLLKARFPRLDQIQELPTELLYQAIMRNELTISGAEPVDCHEEVKAAMQPIIVEIGRHYRSRYSGGVQFSAIVISGGGGGAAFTHLNDRLLEHKNVFPAEKIASKMRFGAIRGASKGLITALANASWLA
jgi:hypothetical protein